MSEHISVRTRLQGGVQYTIGTGFGCWAKSYERRVLEGTVRKISGKLMYAWRVYDQGIFRKSEIWWTPVNDSENTAECLKAWIERGWCA